MNREQAINYLKSSGMSDEQIEAVVDAFTCEDAISRQAVLDIIEDDKQDGCYSCFEDAEEFEQKVRDIQSVTPKTDVLDKIRAEVEQLPTQTRTNWNGCCPDIDYPEIEYIDVTKHQLLSIIDKYAESEET